MFKLRPIIEIIEETRSLFESPMRISKLDMDLLDDHHKNFAYTKISKEKTKKVDKYEKYDIYQFITRNTIHDIFIYGDFTVAFFSYNVKDEHLVEEKVWQDHLHFGLCRDILFNYYLKKFNGIISDGLHTEFGERYWDKLLTQANKSGYETYVLKNEIDKIPLDLDDIHKYFTDGTEGLKYRFVIKNKL